jgi:hypothetical protein
MLRRTPEAVQRENPWLKLFELSDYLMSSPLSARPINVVPRRLPSRLPLIAPQFFQADAAARRA